MNNENNEFISLDLKPLESLTLKIFLSLINYDQFFFLL